MIYLNCRLAGLRLLPICPSCVSPIMPELIHIHFEFDQAGETKHEGL